MPTKRYRVVIDLILSKYFGEWTSDKDEVQSQLYLLNGYKAGNTYMPGMLRTGKVSVEEQDILMK